MKEQDYKTTALYRLTDRHRSDETFLAILDTLVKIKEERQQQYLDIADTFLDIDKSEGKNLDLIGKLIGEERTLVNFIDRSYFGFLGARLSESYDIGYWYSLYKNKYGTLRTLTDEEYRRVLKARVVKNSSDSSRDSFLKVLNILLDNKSSVVIESENNKAIEVRIEDEDGLASYFLSKYKSNTNLIPIPLGRRLGVVHTEQDIPSTTPWSYTIIPYHDNPGYENLTPPTDGWVENDTMPYNDDNAWIRDPNLNVIWVRKTVSVDASTRLFLTFAADNGCVVWVDNVLVGSSNRDNLDIDNNHNNPVELDYLLGEKSFVNILIKAFTESTDTTQGGNILNVDIDRVEVGTPYNLTVEFKND